MTYAQALDKVEQIFIDRELPHDMEAINALADMLSDREKQLAEARELAHLGGWSK